MAAKKRPAPSTPLPAIPPIPPLPWDQEAGALLDRTLDRLAAVMTREGADREALTDAWTVIKAVRDSFRSDDRMANGGSARALRTKLAVTSKKATTRTIETAAGERTKIVLNARLTAREHAKAVALAMPTLGVDDVANDEVRTLVARHALTLLAFGNESPIATHLRKRRKTTPEASDVKKVRELLFAETPPVSPDRIVRIALVVSGYPRPDNTI